MNKPKTKEEWEIWAGVWDAASHEEKIRLCADLGITYDAGKHWRSDNPFVPIKGRQKINNYPELTMLEGQAKETVRELLGVPTINLDYVCLDIETTNLTADFSVMLTACIKPFGKKGIMFRGDELCPNWKESRSNDKELVQAVANELYKHAVVITHYGSRFDMPYLRAKMAKHGIPPLPPMYSIDTWRVARDNFALSSRRLKALSDYFELGHKTDVGGQLWLKAGLDGSKEAMDWIVAHNEQDCEILERLAQLVFPYIRSMRKV